ncbi:MAG: ABC transporter permease [Acidimicrobiia bacterium]|nr:ABC transporter permease [Acidimicrobiia bacterium]MBT8216532.1 ABC transporter permease [Acidimicrobiia bacterium]NNF11465.1 ABC transporter permease [Acidimicrobiia bacterium]NNL71317.1 ABC transporter permease [Acidimicrobiia bacterium]
MTAAESTVRYDSDILRRPLITEFQNFWRFRGLIRLLVVRDLTVRYKRSVLGVWWTILNPMLTIGVLWIVFSNFFGRGGALEFGEPYIVYLTAGILIATYFSQGVIAAGSAIVNSRNVLIKMYIPPEIFSLAAGVAAATHFCLSLIPLLLLTAFLGPGIPWTIVLVPIPLALMLMLVTGLGLLVASAAVYFRDVLDITRVLTQLLNYLIPTFWTLDFIAGSPKALVLVKSNPVYSFLVVFRTWVYGGEMPPAWNLIMMAGSAVLALALGVYVFSRNWRRVVVRL